MSSYYLSKLISEAPLRVVFTLTFASIVYWMYDLLMCCICVVFVLHSILYCVVSDCVVLLLEDSNVVVTYALLKVLFHSISILCAAHILFDATHPCGDFNHAQQGRARSDCSAVFAVLVSRHPDSIDCAGPGHCGVCNGIH